MIYICTDSRDPAYNLALEEYVFTGLPKDESYLILWQNDRSVIIGKHQNAPQEVDLNEAERLGIPVIRRMSGGGAVYHDSGNLNYTFIVPGEGTEEDKRRLAGFLIRACELLGLKAQLSGRNDVTLDGMKISGTAGYVDGGRHLFHGTILMKADTDTMGRVLRFSKDKYHSKAVESVAARVTDLSMKAGRDISAEECRNAFLQAVFGGACGNIDGSADGNPGGNPGGDTLDAVLYIPAADEIDPKRDLSSMNLSGINLPELNLSPILLPPEGVREICRIRDEKYGTWQWNIGYFPMYARLTERYIEGCGRMELSMNVVSGELVNLFLGGDYLLGSRPIEELIDLLIGHPMRREVLVPIVNRAAIDKYIPGMTPEVFTELLFS